VTRLRAAQFENALCNGKRIELEKELEPELVEHPRETVLEIPNRDIPLSVRDKKIGDIFEDAGRNLLINQYIDKMFKRKEKIKHSYTRRDYLKRWNVHPPD
jgi:hypothetical protein